MFENEVKKRRTFAIISHPDAGKTTLTEKLLLYGGAIRMAGSVKSRKAKKYAVSDWMEIEKQRGISVTSSVMQFNYDDHCINILDTPGHQDFSEDTYRTLMAADSAVMLIDGAKGVEPQTIKLFHVCKMRGIPIFTFINKLDRSIKDPFSLLDELEDVLGIRSYPMNWPIGVDGDFKGIYNRQTNQILLFEGGNHGQTHVNSISGSLDDDAFNETLGSYYHDRLREEIELLEGAGDHFDLDKVLEGNLTPVYFGSAMSNFGVKTFLESFLEITPPPLSRMAGDTLVKATDEYFSAFIFKIQANMNPAHRDRLAFARICSGQFIKGMNVYHVQGKKEIKLAQPQQLMAQERTTVEEAFAGDIIGLFDPGIFRIGDTLTTGDRNMEFDPIPMFPSEYFCRVAAKDSMKRKQFIKGVNQLSQEGAVQIFKQVDIGIEELIIGAVGALQFDVLEFRLQNEYNVEIVRTGLPYRFARWIKTSPCEYDRLNLPGSAMITRDMEQRLVILFENEWSIKWATDKNKGLELTDII